MKRWKEAVFAALSCAGATVGQAEMYVCGAAGSVEYRDDARGENCRKFGPAPLGAVSASGGARKPAPAAPSVSTQEDEERGRLELRTRIVAERERLDALRREYDGGQPERRGDERNYARYQARVAALKQDIERSEAAQAALEQELAALERQSRR
jgi:hypothetical protein